MARTLIKQKGRIDKGIKTLRIEVREEVCKLLSELSQTQNNAFGLTKTIETYYKVQTGKPKISHLTQHPNT